MKDSSRVGYRRVEQKDLGRGRVNGDMEQDTEEQKRRSMEEEGFNWGFVVGYRRVEKKIYRRGRV